MRSYLSRAGIAGALVAIASLTGLVPGPLAPAAGLAADATLYQDLGGEAGIERLVDRTIRHYLSDPRIKDQFDNINFVWLEARITAHICQVTGGPCVYKGRSMKAAHKGLHLTEADFNAGVEGLEAAMDDLGIPFRTQNRLLAVLAPMERDIVSR